MDEIRREDAKIQRKEIIDLEKKVKGLEEQSKFLSGQLTEIRISTGYHFVTGGTLVQDASHVRR
jgi:hypothetical protein